YIEGSNIGSSAKEPEWTEPQIAKINSISVVRLNRKVVNDTRRVVPDKNGKYVTYDTKGTAVTRAAAFLNNIPPSDYCIGMGKPKGDQKTGKTKLYSDIVMRAKDGSWVTNQWTCEGIVIEGVPKKILDRSARKIHTAGGMTNERRIGHDFARIGLPRVYFCPLFETLRSKYPKLLDGVSVTVGYYWINASWGVTGNPGRYKYMTGPNDIGDTQKLSEILRMIGGKSSLTQSTIAISTAFNGKLVGNSIVKDGEGCDMSIKVHNAFHMAVVDYRSPPQTSSTGFELTDDLIGKSEFLKADLGTTKSVMGVFGVDDEDEDDDDDENDEGKDVGDDDLI
ncbi:hypothetical protein QBC39DRAFT_264826, partial [Podospora conica]